MVEVSLLPIRGCEFKSSPPILRKTIDPHVFASMSICMDYDTLYLSDRFFYAVDLLVLNLWSHFYWMRPPNVQVIKLYFGLFF